MRRKRLPPDLAQALSGFEQVLAVLEPAKEALTSVMPTTRLPGVPLPDALARFESDLGLAREAMPPWRRPETDTEWAACLAGLDESLRRARRLRREAPELGGFEGLIWAVEQLLGPLEPFRTAAERFRSLRVPMR